MCNLYDPLPATLAAALTSSFYSVIGLVSPIMLESLDNGGTYFFFAAFAVLGFTSVCEPGPVSLLSCQACQVLTVPCLETFSCPRRVTGR